MERIALFPGSFNPFTEGHADVVRRGLHLFDSIIIAIGHNSEKPLQDTHNLVANIQEIYKDEPRVKVCYYENLTADLVAKTHATCILRGIRNQKDLDYEEEIAQVNYTCFGVETVFLLASPKLKEVSSSVVRELQKYGKDVSSFLPKCSKSKE